MAKPDLGPGEREERARKRRFWGLIGALFLTGVPVGFFTAHFETGGDAGVDGALPPWFAALAAAVTVTAIIGGSWLMHRRIDELERRDNLVANSAGVFVMVGLYPAWLLLWKGGLVGEPRHEVLFLLTFGVVLLTYIWLKLRQRF